MNIPVTKIIYSICWSCRQLDADIKEDFLVRIGDVFGVERPEASHLYTLLLQCMDHRQSVSETAFMNISVLQLDTWISYIIMCV